MFAPTTVNGIPMIVATGKHTIVTRQLLYSWGEPPLSSNNLRTLMRPTALMASVQLTRAPFRLDVASCVNLDLLP